MLISSLLFLVLCSLRPKKQIMHQNLYLLIAAYPTHQFFKRKVKNLAIRDQQKIRKDFLASNFLCVSQLYPISFRLDLFLGILTSPSCGRLQSISRRTETLSKVVFLFSSLCRSCRRAQGWQRFGRLMVEYRLEQ